MNEFEKITESTSLYRNLEQKSVHELLVSINTEDRKVALAVEEALPQIEVLVETLIPCLQRGGRLFYLGAGTSGRLGILDASECPPTFGVPSDLVTGLIAGGDQAIRKAVENAEDDAEQAWKDLQEHKIGSKDFVIGIAASGTTPYVVGGIQKLREKGTATGCITCNPQSPLSKASEFPVEVVVGPEFITGSSRMKAGTAQKMVLNMISTTAMIRMGRVKGNKMIDMQLSNAKLIERGIRQIREETKLSYSEARDYLQKYGSVRKVLQNLKTL